MPVKDLYTQLQNHYYACLPFPMKRKVIEDAVAAFFKFLEEPEAIKTHIDFSIAPKHRRGDVGYRHREAADHIYNDCKEFFHYHPAIFKHDRDFIEANPIVKDFLTKAQPIWELTARTIDHALRSLEPHFPGIHAKIFDTQEEIHIQLRFLKYEWTVADKYLAKPHFDAGSFTLAIAESTPGLRIGSGPENLTPVEHQPENAIFMLSSNFQTIMQTQVLSPGWHDVIQLNETLIGKAYARWAVVAFIEAQNVEALPRSETHKYYQAAV